MTKRAGSTPSQRASSAGACDSTSSAPAHPKLKAAKRRDPTRREKREIAQRQGDLCFFWGCSNPIEIYEHWATVALGNDGPPDCGVCEGHAGMKTYGGKYGDDWRAVGGDIRDIKHTRKIAEGRTQFDKRKRAGGSRIKGRGFDKAHSRKFDGTVVRK